MISSYINKPAAILVIGMALATSLTHCGRDKYAELPVYQNPSRSLDERVDDLVGRMTLEEKIAQTMNAAPAIERLGVPAYNWWNECLHGVGRAGLATVFPQAIGLGAMWDTEHMLRVATVTSDEARAKHHEFERQGKRNIYQGLTFWTPNINIFRDPRWGRGMETYGEDPHLMGQMAAAFIRGLQGDDPHYLKLVATAKHYAVHSGPEPDRHTFDAVISERDLRQTYLPHFKAGIVDAGAYSVMCAYNRYKGEPACSSPSLLDKILRDEWDFEGYVVSDCGAIQDIYARHEVVETAEEAAAAGVIAGCDLNCGRTYEALSGAVAQGLISEEEIDVSVRRLFRARFRLGMFDPAEDVPYAAIPYSVVDSDEHKEVALEAARKSIVLLKNEGNLLPLSKDAGKIAVIGPNADDVEVLLANYNGFPSSPVTPVNGIRAAVEGSSEVVYARGSDWAEGMPYFEVIPSEFLFSSDGLDRENGLNGEYFSSANFAGRRNRIKQSTSRDPRDQSGETLTEPESLFERIDSVVDFNWWEDAPRDDMDSDDFGVRWTGYLVPPESGEYWLGGYGFNAFRLFLDGTQLLDFNAIHHPSMVSERVELEAGNAYEIKLEYAEYLNNAMMKLVWARPGRDAHAEAVGIAASADVVVMALGLSPRLEGEEMRGLDIQGFKAGDRTSLNLPAVQEKLLEDVVSLGKPVVLVLLNGSAVAVNWANEHVPAIVEVWYPGQAAGTAIADVLFGDYNPAGRLPITFYQSVDQLPPFDDYDMAGHTYRYFEGTPLYPFGYGLSYTNFTYTVLDVPEIVEVGEGVSLSVEVTNAGARAGEEVVQVYVTDLEASVPVPLRTLAGFKRINLEPGDTERVTFQISPEQLAVFSEGGEWVVEEGAFRIAVGGGQPGFDVPTTEVLTTTVRVNGSIVL